MPTVCHIITTAQYFNAIISAASSDSSDYADTVPRVSLVLVSINLLIKWICWLYEFICMVPVSYEFIKPMNSCISSLQIHQTYEFIYFTKFIMWIQLIIILCVNSFYKGIHLLFQFFFQTHMMPMTEPAPTKATTMNKIGYKKIKRNDSVYKQS